MYLGVDIGGTKTLLGVFSKQGKLLDTARFETPKTYETFLNVLRRNIERFGDDIQMTCVAAPGKVDREHGKVTAYGNLPWKNTPLAKDVEHITKSPVLIDNDGNLAGLSEANNLKGDFKKVLYLTISTGIGSGIITSGMIDPDFADSEAGHMMLQHNDKLMAWEDFASGRAITERYNKRASDINDKATWRKITHDIARGILNIVAIAEPDVIIIGGGVGYHFDKFDGLLREQLKKYETPLTPIPPIKKAKKPEEAVLYGCLELIKQHQKIKS